MERRDPLSASAMRAARPESVDSVLRARVRPRGGPGVDATHRPLTAVVGLLKLCRWNIPEGLEQTPVVEPVDPFERRELHGVDVSPWSASADDLGLVEAVDALRERVV